MAMKSFRELLFREGPLVLPRGYHDSQAQEGPEQLR